MNMSRIATALLLFTAMTCASAGQKPAGTGSGTGGDATTGGEAGPVATGGAGGGSSGGGGTGGGGGAPSGGGSGGTTVPDAATADAPSSTDGAGDSPAITGDGGYMGVVSPTMPWQRECPAGTSKSDCCMLYCGCMMKYCPATLPASCQAACVAASNWDLVCRTYQCFASQNPNFPQDHDSHCKHAIGQLGKCGNR